MTSRTVANQYADYEDIFGAQLGFFQSAALNLWGLVDVGDFATLAEGIPDDVWANSATQSDGTPYTKQVLSDRALLHQGTRNAWALIQKGATPDGTHRQQVDYATFTTEAAGMWAAPRFSGGCWQYDLSSLPFPCDDGPDWKDPSPGAQTLGVFQVTLMSGLYLSFCCSLWAAAKSKAAQGKTGGALDQLQSPEAYQQSADEVVGFLTNWLDGAGTDSLASVREQGVLVHERTPTYAQMGDGDYPALEGYLDGSFWGGDQGLIMGALTQYGQLSAGAAPKTPGEHVQPISTAYPGALLAGVFFNLQQNENIGSLRLLGPVGPYLAPAGSPISNDSNDYGSGSGIFWRYVMRCCRLDPGFNSSARTDPTISAVATISGSNLNDWGNALFQPFNTVSAAIGAWYLLK